MEKKIESIGWHPMFIGLIIIEGILLVLLVSLFSSPVVGVAGENVTVLTRLQVGEVAPEVLNVSIENGSATLTLVANSTKLVSCVAIIRDWNNDTTISAVWAEFFDTVASNFSGPADNNDHYSNSSCTFNTSFVSWNGINDTNYTALANCTFSVQYYANAETWNCTVVANDSVNWSGNGSDDINISELLAVGLPAEINYGTVNSTYVSNENVTNVSNCGNVDLNLSLSGYAQSEGDGYAMNCSLGAIGYIPIYYEKYNLTDSIAGDLSLTEFEANYTNLTSSPVVKQFNLTQRTNDVVDDTGKPTHWRIYVPIGVAGTCSGNIVFGATQASAP